MDYRTLSKLIVKLGGAFILVQTISWWPSYLTPAMELLKASPGAFVGAAIVPLLLPFIAGVVLFSFPGTIANKVLVPEAQPDSNSIASQQIERVLLSVLGVYLAFHALADFAFGAAKLISFRQLFEEQVPNMPSMLST